MTLRDLARFLGAPSNVLLSLEIRELSQDGSVDVQEGILDIDAPERAGIFLRAKRIASRPQLLAHCYCSGKCVCILGQVDAA